MLSYIYIYIYIYITKTLDLSWIVCNKTLNTTQYQMMLSHIYILHKPSIYRGSYVIRHWTQHNTKGRRLRLWSDYELYCRIWSWSPVLCEKHGPRDSVDKNRDRRPRFISLLRPEGHVFHTARETMIKSYYSTLSAEFFSMFYSHKYEF